MIVAPEVSSIIVLSVGRGHGGIGSNSPPILPGPLVGHSAVKFSQSRVLVKKLLLSPPSQGMAARNARVRKPPEKYAPAMKGKKYAVAMTQIAESLKESKHGLAMAQMSVKLMSKGEHRRADIVGMIMAQLSMKAAIKKWGEKA